VTIERHKPLQRFDTRKLSAKRLKERYLKKIKTPFNMNEDKLYNILIAISIIGIIVVLVLIFTTKTTESFTELYFEDHQDLPSEYLLDEYEFEFTIHNLENQALDYEYNVYIEYYDNEKLKETSTIEKSNIILEHDSTVTIKQEFEITKEYDYAKVIVETNGQEIHFWLRSEE